MENRVIFEQYSDYDKNINTLACIKAECLYSRKHKLCDCEACNNCDTQRKFLLCYNGLALCDQFRVDLAAEALSAKYSINKKEILKKDRMFKISKFSLLTLLFILIFSFVCVSVFAEKSYEDEELHFDLGLSEALRKAHDDNEDTDSITSSIGKSENNLKKGSDKYNKSTHPDTEWIFAYDRDEPIQKIIRYVNHATERDYNGDGLFNCIDYAILFKYYWDLNYPPEQCEIVRNKNYTNGFHHLFVRVRGRNNRYWMCIEPSASYDSLTGKYFKYLMYDAWGSRYEPYFNIYGETERWMHQKI